MYYDGIRLLDGSAKCKNNGHDKYICWPGSVSSQHPQPSYVRPHVAFEFFTGVDNCFSQHLLAAIQHDFQRRHSSLFIVEQISLTNVSLWISGVIRDFFDALYKYGTRSEANRSRSGLSMNKY